MKNIFKKALVTLVLLAGSVTMAAAEYCIDVEKFLTLVGKDFSPPGKGVCNEFRGDVDGTSYPLNQFCSPAALSLKVKGNPYRIQPILWIPAPFEDIELEN